MKRISIFVATCLMSAANFAFGQTHTQSISFDDGVGPGNASTYNSTDSFGFDMYLTYSGYDSSGFSLWLETQTSNNFSGSLFITGMTYGTAFPVATQPPPPFTPFDVSFGVSPGYLREGRDLGALVTGEGNTFLPQPPGTYFVGHVSFTINGALPGTYILRSTTVFPDASEVTSDDGTTFDDNFLPATTYTITIVPEPSPFVLLILMAVGLSATFYRRAVSKQSRS